MAPVINKTDEEEKKRRHTTQENDFIDVNKNMSQRPTQTRGKNVIVLIVEVFYLSHKVLQSVDLRVAESPSLSSWLMLA